MFFRKFTIAAVLTFSCAAASHAELKRVAPIRATSDIPAWMQALAIRGAQVRTQGGGKTPYTECAETLEIPGAFLCQSYDYLDMNLALGRASAFTEGGVPGLAKNELPRNSDPRLKRYQSMVAGHDLKVFDLLTFANQVRHQCARTHDADLCPNEYETEAFTQFFLPLLQTNRKFVVVTFANRGYMSYRDVVSHEILHAQYFMQPNYRQIADAFWEHSVSNEDKAVVLKRLAPYYDTRNDFLMRNEFQAYMLMFGAEKSELGPLVGKFRPALMAEMLKAGIVPIQVH